MRPARRLALIIILGATGLWSVGADMRAASADAKARSAEPGGQDADAAEAASSRADHEAPDASEQPDLQGSILALAQSDDFAPAEIESPARSDVASDALINHPAIDRGRTESSSWRSSGRFWTAAEIAAILAGGGMQYWTERDGSPHWAPGDWPNRFSTDALILDTNDFRTNYAFHTVAGASYHVAARASDLSLLESAAWNLGASLTWEYVVEFRDKADVNDIVFTTPAGVAMGEFSHRLGRLLHQGREGRAWDIARWTLGFPQSFDDAVAGRSSPRGPPIAHDIDVGLGFSRATRTETRGGESAAEHAFALPHVELSATLTALPQRGGRGWRLFSNAEITSLDLQIAGGSGRENAVYVLSDTVLAGAHFSDVTEDGTRGLEASIGTSTALRYDTVHYGGSRDRLSVAHLPGLAVDTDYWRDSFQAQLSARVHPDYGGMHALGYPAWQDRNPDERGLSTVEEEGYYHAFGGSARLAVELGLARLRAGGEVFAAAYWPHRGLDEFRQGRPHHEPDEDREAITLEQSIRSRIVSYDVWLRGELGRGVFAEARAEARRGRERFEEVYTRARAMRLGVAIGITL